MSLRERLEALSQRIQAVLADQGMFIYKRTEDQAAFRSTHGFDHLYVLTLAYRKEDYNSLYAQERVDTALRALASVGIGREMFEPLPNSPKSYEDYMLIYCYLKKDSIDDLV